MANGNYNNAKPRPWVVFAGVVFGLIILSLYESISLPQYANSVKEFYTSRKQLFFNKGTSEPEIEILEDLTMVENENEPLDQDSSLDDEALLSVEYSPSVFLQKDNTLSNAVCWSGNYDQIRSWSDLPRILDFDPKTWSKEGKTKVCVFTRTPRQDSLFRTNIISQFGSNKYSYEILRSTDCQYHGRCMSPQEARKHPQCDGENTRTVHLLERIKCCQHDRYDRVLSNGMKYYDVLVSTGDEFCRATSSIGMAHFRTYAGHNIIRSPTSPNAPEYLPLGPREEFARVRAQHVLLPKGRKYLFNFIGSITSPSRKLLGQKIRSFMKENRGRVSSFIHIVQEWSKRLTQMNGYILPGEYRRVLMNSTFTLCPEGHNPEAYRIYEAAEAGSIPILVLDNSYKKHECKCSFKPLIDSGAPFIFLRSWSQLPEFLLHIQNDHKRIQKLQADVMHWYKKFMTKIAKNFEAVLEARFQDRMENGKYTATATYDAITTLFED